MLEPGLGSSVYNVKWSSFEWRTHDGAFWDCKTWIEGEWWPSNGCVVGDVIHWNIHTPGVIRHEAGHAILRKLGHPCHRYISLDSKITFHKYLDGGAACKNWICNVWGCDGQEES
jgi:hypothetical protein